MLKIAFNMEYTTGNCTRGIVIYLVARECFEENSLGIGNGILQRILGLRILLCGSRTYWVFMALSSCDVFYFSAHSLEVLPSAIFRTSLGNRWRLNAQAC